MPRSIVSYFNSKPKTNPLTSREDGMQVSLDNDPKLSEPSLIWECTWRNQVVKIKDIWDYVKRINNIMYLLISSKGLDIRGTDATNAILIHIHLNASDFYSYIYTCEKTFAAMVDFAKLAQKFQRFNRVSDNINCALNKLPLSTKLLQFVCRGIHFTAKFCDCMDIYKECDAHIGLEVSPLVPEVKFHTTCNIELIDLLDILTFAKDHSDRIRFKTNADTKTLVIEGVSTDDSTFYYKQIKALKEKKILEDCDTIYNLEFLLDILKIPNLQGSKKQNQIQLEFSTGMHLKITFFITKQSYICAYLASADFNDNEDDVNEDPLENLEKMK